MEPLSFERQRVLAEQAIKKMGYGIFTSFLPQLKGPGICCEYFDLDGHVKQINVLYRDGMTDRDWIRAVQDAVFPK